MSNSCDAVIHTSVGPTKNCDRWVVDPVTNTPQRRSKTWFKENPGKHAVVLTPPGGSPPALTDFDKDANLDSDHVLCEIDGKYASGRRGRDTYEGVLGPDTSTNYVKALQYSPYEEDRVAYEAARSADQVEQLMLAQWSLTDEQFTALAERYPHIALEYASDRLTDEQFAIAIERNSSYAIRYTSDRLTDEQFAVAIELFPNAALRYASDRLTDAQLMSILEKQPRDVLEYASDRLTDEQFTIAIERYPHYALEYAKDRLTDEQLAVAAEREPFVALRYASDRLTDEQRTRLEDLDWREQ